MEHADIIKGFLDEVKGSFYSGRPDMLIEYRRNGVLERLVIGEFKYSLSKQTFSKGLKELSRYIHFAKEVRKEGHLIDDEEVDVSGIFIIDKVPAKADADLVYEGNGYSLEIYDTEKLMELYDDGTAKVID